MAATAYALSQAKKLRESRNECVKATNVIMSRAETEKRDMSEDELGKFNEMADKIAGYDTRISKLEEWTGVNEEKDEEDRDDEDDKEKKKKEEDDNERKNKAKKTGEERQGDIVTLADGRRVILVGSDADTRTNPSRPPKGGSGKKYEVRRNPLETAESFRNRQRRATEQYLTAVRDYLEYGKPGLAQHAGENRALQADLDIQGGYLVLPEQAANVILKAVDNILFVRQVAQKFRLQNAQSLGIPSIEANLADADWTTEIAQMNADSTNSYGKRALTPSPVRKRILVSERFIRMAMSFTYASEDEGGANGGTGENIVLDRLAYMIALTMEKAFMTGNGTGRPLGVFTASNRGISTGRDVATGSATGITYDGLYNAKYTLKAQYWKSAAWCFHRDFLKRVLQLKDSNGRPLIDFQTLPGQPTMLLEMPFYLSELAPNTFTSTSYVAVLGNWKYYWIADSQEVSIKKAEELYAETAQVGFFIAAESDGMPVQEEAFVRLQCA